MFSAQLRHVMRLARYVVLKFGFHLYLTDSLFIKRIFGCYIKVHLATETFVKSSHLLSCTTFVCTSLDFNKCGYQWPHFLMYVIHRDCMLEESVFVKSVAECCFDYNPHRYGYIVTWCQVFRWDLIKTGRVPDVTMILQITTKRFRSIMRSWRSVKVSCLLLWNFWNACYVFPLSSHDVYVVKYKKLWLHLYLCVSVILGRTSLEDATTELQKLFGP